MDSRGLNLLVKDNRRKPQTLNGHRVRGEVSAGADRAS